MEKDRGTWYSRNTRLQSLHSRAVARSNMGADCGNNIGAGQLQGLVHPVVLRHIGFQQQHVQLTTDTHQVSSHRKGQSQCSANHPKCGNNDNNKWDLHSAIHPHTVGDVGIQQQHVQLTTDGTSSQLPLQGPVAVFSKPTKMW